MPVRPELRAYYGPTWRAYRAALIEAHGARCRRCGRECPRYLNLAHLERDPRASSVVALLCPSCHASHDYLWNRALARRTNAERVGQLWLLPEIEWSAAAAYAIPADVFAGAQGSLF